jgi:hypothetical protein
VKSVGDGDGTVDLRQGGPSEDRNGVAGLAVHPPDRSRRRQTAIVDEKNARIAVMETGHE